MHGIFFYLDLCDIHFHKDYTKNITTGKNAIMLLVGYTSLALLPTVVVAAQAIAVG